MRIAILVLVFLAHGASVAAAQESSSHCPGAGPGARWYAEQSVVLLTNPLGAELEQTLGLCTPLLTEPGLMFDLTHVDFGLSTQTTFGYLNVGPYVEIVPISPWVLRVESHAVAYFPGGFDGTGYHGRTTGNAPYGEEDTRVEDAESEMGWNVVLHSALQGEFAITDQVSIQAYNGFFAEYWAIVSDAYYVNVRWDLIMEATDWLLRNEAFLGISIDIEEDHTLALGAHSALAYVPSTDYFAHKFSGIAAWETTQVSSSVSAVSVFAGVGGHTHHAFRTGVTLTGGASITYDLGAL